MYILKMKSIKYIRDRKIYLYIGTGWEYFSRPHFTPSRRQPRINLGKIEKYESRVKP